MRAELDASLCIPKDQPVSLTVDEIGVDARVSGTPHVTISPIELGLPDVTVTIPDVTITLPAPTLSLKVNSGTTNALADYFYAMYNLLDSVTPTDTIAKVEIFAAASFALPAGAIKALALPALEVDVALNLGQLKIDFDKPLKVDVGAFTLHSDREEPPVTVGADLGNSGVAVSVDPLHAAVAGCVVLNGGDPPCPPSTGERPHSLRPRLIELHKDVNPDKTTVELSLHGQGFGAAQGAVSLTAPGISLSPLQYIAWADSVLRVKFHVATPGAYAVVLTTAMGVTSDPIALTVP